MTAKLESTEYYLAVEDTEGALEFARDRFIFRFGQEPESVTAGKGGIIMAGPVPSIQKQSISNNNPQIDAAKIGQLGLGI